MAYVPSRTTAPTSAATATPLYRPVKDPNTDYDILAKSIIIGDSSVGKSSLLYRYIDQDWNPHYVATIGVDFKVMSFERNQKVVKLQLWDTAGQERFRTITHTYYRGAHGVMLVFDVTSHESFQHLSDWLGDVQKFAAAGVPLLLVGNKYDAPDAEHEVSDEEALAMARELDCKFIKVSAKSNVNVDEAFAALVEMCVDHRMNVLRKLEDVNGKKKRQPLRFGDLDNDHKKVEKSGPCEC